MTDRELLKLAAKAAGIFGEWVENSTEGEYYKLPTSGIKTFSEGRVHIWNPLTSSGDALRLAVKLKLRIATECNQEAAYASDTRGLVDASNAKGLHDPVPWNGDAYAATRRAIVRAASAISTKPVDIGLN